jgi:CubicO group peptidase (beta-lactamase class C family)
MLLSHRSGLPNYIYFMDAEKKNLRYVTNNDVLNYLVSKKPNMSYKPGHILIIATPTLF